jgi:hypothetical protein
MRLRVVGMLRDFMANQRGKVTPRETLKPFVLTRVLKTHAAFQGSKKHA